MKKSLAHLPKPKRDELKRVKEIILDECPTVLMIILFGSHARGDWVEDRHFEGNVLHEYMSDFDILVIVRSNQIVNSKDTWRRAETRARRFPNRTWTNLIGGPRGSHLHISHSALDRSFGLRHVRPRVRVPLRLGGAGGTLELWRERFRAPQDRGVGL